MADFHINMWWQTLVEETANLIANERAEAKFGEGGAFAVLENSYQSGVDWPDRWDMTFKYELYGNVADKAGEQERKLKVPLEDVLQRLMRGEEQQDESS